MANALFIKDVEDPIITDEIANKIIDFLDLPEKKELFLKLDDKKENITCSEKLNELYPESNQDTYFNFFFFLKKKSRRRNYNGKYFR